MTRSRKKFRIQATQAVLSARKNNQLATCKNYAKSLSFVFFNSLVLLPGKKNSLVLWVGVAGALDATPGSPQPQQGDIDILYACKQLNIHQSSPPRNV